MPTRFWGKRGGGYFAKDHPKGHAVPWGYVIKIKRGATGSNSNSQPKQRSDAMLLSDHAARYGFHNGKRLQQAGRH